jgi:hypothetical protein
VPATPESALADDNQPLRAEACGAKGGLVKSVGKKNERSRIKRKNSKKGVEKSKEGKIWTKYIIRIEKDNTESTKLVVAAGSQLSSCSITCRAAGAGGRGQAYTCRFGGSRLGRGVWWGGGGGRPG